MASASARKMISYQKNSGGAGFKRWPMEILAQQIALSTNQMDSQEGIGFVFRASMNTLQLEFGWANHFLAHQHKIVTKTITPTSTTSIQSNAVATSILSINGGWTPPKQRDANIHIGNLSVFTEADLSAHELCLFHQTFQALQVTTLADIVEPSGKYIRMSSFQCTAAVSSPYSWPIRKTMIMMEHKGVCNQFHVKLHPTQLEILKQDFIPIYSIIRKI